MAAYQVGEPVQGGTRQRQPSGVANPGLRSEDFRWLDSPAGTLLFERGNGLLCAINLTDQPMPPPEATSPLIASAPLTKDGLLPPDSTALLYRD
ncbi:hypothetical protein ACFWBS_50395 [Streptomyces mirabilis]|uniref:hypothetical protein n=1 Tax=Streptomyces mirabilis TaxID=68239 RepID=UPI0036493E9F